MKDGGLFSHFVYFETIIKVTNNILSCKCHKSVTFAQVVLNVTIFHSHLLGLSHRFLEKGKNSIKFIQLFCLALYSMYFSEYPLFLLRPNFLDRPGSSFLFCTLGKNTSLWFLRCCSGDWLRRWSPGSMVLRFHF